MDQFTENMGRYKTNQRIQVSCSAYPNNLIIDFFGILEAHQYKKILWMVDK
jgi:uncharacterized protein Veg